MSLLAFTQMGGSKSVDHTGPEILRRVCGENKTFFGEVFKSVKKKFNTKMSRSAVFCIPYPANGLKRVGGSQVSEVPAEHLQTFST